MFGILIYATVFVVAVCGLAYQLVTGTVASYLLGDSVSQFSIVVGTFVSALGLGAYGSRHLHAEPARTLIDVGYAAAIVGGTSSEVLFLAFNHGGFFKPILFAVVIASGALVGLELPLLLRLLKRHVHTRELVARALALDYAGAVVGSLAFSLLAIPRLGSVRTALAFGLLQVAAAFAATWALAPLLAHRTALRIKGALAFAALAALFVMAPRFAAVAEDGMFPDPVVFARHTRYQRIVVTAGHGSVDLYLDGNLQFASADEFRYHEALVHPAFAAAPVHRRVLVLGGGDGLATREILRYPDVEHVTLVDLDPAMTDMARHFEPVVRLNRHALDAPRVRVINDDAMVWLGEGTDRFDVAIVDFPDPNNYALGKLYTTRFYALLRARLEPDAVVSIQSTSPWMARQSFWCVARTMEAAGFHTLPYHAFVPSFGEWGYVLGSMAPLRVPQHTLADLQYLDDAVLPTLFVFSRDMAPVPAEINRLNNQVLVQYYEREWRRWAN